MAKSSILLSINLKINICPNIISLTLYFDYFTFSKSIMINFIIDIYIDFIFFKAWYFLNLNLVIGNLRRIFCKAGILAPPFHDMWDYLWKIHFQDMWEYICERSTFKTCANSSSFQRNRSKVLCTNSVTAAWNSS